MSFVSQDKRATRTSSVFHHHLLRQHKKSVMDDLDDLVEEVKSDPGQMQGNLFEAAQAWVSATEDLSPDFASQISKVLTAFYTAAGTARDLELQARMVKATMDSVIAAFHRAPDSPDSYSQFCSVLKHAIKAIVAYLASEDHWRDRDVKELTGLFQATIDGLCGVDDALRELHRQGFLFVNPDSPKTQKKFTRLAAINLLWRQGILALLPHVHSFVNSKFPRSLSKTGVSKVAEHFGVQVRCFEPSPQCPQYAERCLTRGFRLFRCRSVLCFVACRAIWTLECLSSQR